AALEAEGLLVSAPPDLPPLTAVTTDSRRAGAGALFCAVEGTAVDGHRFVADAARAGAAAALVSRTTDTDLPQVVVRDGRLAAAVVAAAFYGHPARDLRLVGVTGTNGKSTTVAVTRHLLNAAGDTGALGTLGAFDGRGERLPDAGLTTPGPVDLHATFAAMRDRGVRTLIMETSSHALHQGRTHGVRFAAGVYTNLTREHLDYHGDYDSYLAAKLLLSRHLADGAVEAVNTDDPAWGALPDRAELRRIWFGTAPQAAVRAEAPAYDARGTRFRLVCGSDRADVVLPLIGEFNVSNALAAAAVAWGFGMPTADVAARLAAAPQVPGRLERLADRPFTVLRDYAHTPDAITRVLRTLRAITPGQVLVVFGAGGDRDRGKRGPMAAAVAQGADLGIITTDNPRTEDPERILDDVDAGFGGVAHLRVPDREEAIRRALRVARPGDTVLLMGKGHETYQIYGTRKEPFDEPAIVRAALAEIA
ncbi:MAG: UDP-N-acetylmuramoyl-L-alanyl-D-glutamate--2,6-diaminopimelate ligase, partial [Synechococcaceae cyanobacterium]|nr:UDP-N-acetylmuramoyl-L-alanyl-D-glutamate--2,6-diaminopimelate ligase [Synechococcaceae cyanobacterium]